MNDVLLIDVENELLNMTDDASLVNEEITPLTNTKTKSFKRFYLESLIKESPMRYAGTWDTIPLEDWAYNQTEAINFIEGRKGKLIDTFEYSGIVGIYQTNNSDIVEYALIPKTMKTILGYVKLVLIDNHISTNGIWNHSIDGKGLVYNFFIKWLIPHYKLVISDKSTTNLGELFWKKIIQYGLSNNKECGIYIQSEVNLKRPEQFEKLDKIEDFEKAWTDRGAAKRLYIKD